MKYFRVKTWILISFFFFAISCKPDNKDDTKDDESEELDLSYLQTGDGTTTPYIKGTFIDFWHKTSWDMAMWNAHMHEMSEIGIQTVIIQFTAFNNEVWFDAQNTFSTNKHSRALANLLDAANINGIGVFIGLYSDDQYWNNATNISVLSEYVAKCKNIAQDIWQKYKNKPALKAWYIPQEPATYYYQTQSDRNILKNNLINPIAEYCKSISHKPVAFSVFFNHNLTNVASFGAFMSDLSDANVELIILQDGIGVNHCDINSISDYFLQAHQSLYVDNQFEGAFWADIETFQTVSGNTVPENINTIIQKMNNVKDYVSQIVSYQYYKDMCPSGPNGASAESLRNDYLNYLP